jgi:hypothetical protein
MQTMVRLKWSSSEADGRHTYKASQQEQVQEILLEDWPQSYSISGVQILGGELSNNPWTLRIYLVEEWGGSILYSKSRTAPFLSLVEGTEPSYFLFS